MKTKNTKEYEDWKLKNTDSYGSGIFRYAEAWADAMENELVTGVKEVKDIAARTSREADVEGVTGYMYSAALSILINCWEHGEELKEWHDNGEIEPEKSLPERKEESKPALPLTIKNLAICFNNAISTGSEFVAVKIRMNGFPEDEIIINPIRNAVAKLKYYDETYDFNLKHKHTDKIQIVGFTYGNSYSEIEEDLVN